MGHRSRELICLTMRCLAGPEPGEQHESEPNIEQLLAAFVGRVDSGFFVFGGVRCLVFGIGFSAGCRRLGPLGSHYSWRLCCAGCRHSILSVSRLSSEALHPAR